MKLLSIHSDYIEYEAKKKAIKSAEDIKDKKNRLEECLTVFIAVEDIDEQNPDQAAELALQEIKKNCDKVKTNKVMLYPYAHLSPNLAKPDVAVTILKKLEQLVKKEKFIVIRAPFGWYKSFNISCKGHPLSELSSQLIPTKNNEESKEVVSEALKAEEKLKSYWYILDTNGKLVELNKFDFRKHENLKKFSYYEKEKDRNSAKEPAHIPLMKKLELVDYEPASDSGNLRYYPKGRLIKKLLEEYVNDKVIQYGGVEVETPIMYDIKHPTLERYLNKFPARQYQIASDKRTFFLRFAACFGQFLMAKDAIISYKHLPLKLYELTRYSFRREQSGELSGLRRLRAFTMPDVHALCADMKQATSEYKIRLNLCLDTLKGVGIKPKDFEVGLRITEDFYKENKDLVQHIMKKINKPILVEMWKDRKFYFLLKYEFNFIDSVNKAAALSTDQIDVENGESYDIKFTDKNNEQKHPIILHCSPSGAIERVIYTILEMQAKKMEKGGIGSFPLWLAPTQVRIIPVATENHLKKCEQIAKDIFGHNIRTDVDDREESLGKKIRKAGQDWIPYTLVIGDNELKSKKFQVRVRGAKEPTTMTQVQLVKEIQKHTNGFPFKQLPLPMLLSKRPLFSSFQ
ncbi:threonine--tRNA ligase [archaeon]|nr:threonine--tRNA ligase [archaeon]MBL7057077.1 threonine--tRNA ligase [Candidatus Woesearchaeota archaeon]